MRIVDLTLTLRPGMRGVDMEPARRLDSDGWNATTLYLYSHCGTHMDAPAHLGSDAVTIDRIDPARFLIDRAWVIDLHGIAPHATIQVADLGSITDKVAPQDGLLLRTDWGRHVDEPQYRADLPRVSCELARWCADRKVGVLGVETPAVADTGNLEELTEVHRILFDGDVLIVEGLTNLDQLTHPWVRLIALPLKTMDGDGAPARVLALEDDTIGVTDA